MGLWCQSGPKVVPNGSPGNYCKVSNEHVIRHVLVGQNGGSTGATHNFEATQEATKLGLKLEEDTSWIKTVNRKA